MGATFHSTVGLFPTYIISKVRDHPRFGICYPLRRTTLRITPNIGYTHIQVKPVTDGLNNLHRGIGILVDEINYIATSISTSLS